MFDFSQQLFNKNPKAFHLASKAVAKSDFPGTRVKAGQSVKISYYKDVENKLFLGNPTMPVFEVEGLTHYVFASSLECFE